MCRDVRENYVDIIGVIAASKVGRTTIGYFQAQSTVTTKQICVRTSAWTMGDHGPLGALAVFRFLAITITLLGVYTV